MKFNIDRIIDHLLAWDFRVEVGGQEYPTRAPSLGELALLNTKTTDLDTMLTVINSLFIGHGGPDTGAWTIDHVQAFVTGLGEYLKEHSAKNSPTIKARSAAAMVPPPEVKPAALQTQD